MIAEERAVLVAGSDADLDVEDVPLGVPCLLQPALAEARLSSQGRWGAVTEIALRRVHEANRVGGGVRELDEVAGVEPATLEIDRPVYGRQGVPDDDIAVRILVGRPVVDLQRAVMQVSGLAIECSGDHLRPVALCLEERHRVGNPGQEEGTRRADAEGWRGHRQRVAHRQAVGPRLIERTEVQLVDCPIPTIPLTLRTGPPGRAGRRRHRRCGPGTALRRWRRWKAGSPLSARRPGSRADRCEWRPGG